MIYAGYFSGLHALNSSQHSSLNFRLKAAKKARKTQQFQGYI
jgi:hypothetical protein